MPKEAFGGDDEGGGGAAEKKKPELAKFGLSPDTNIRDVFWSIMGSYAAAKKPGLDLMKLDNDRFALMRVAISVISRPHGEQFGLSPRYISHYTLMMLLDAGWGDALGAFLERGAEPRLDMKRNLVLSLRKLLAQEGYRQTLLEFFTQAIRGRETVSVALGYLAQLADAELARALKKELIILARGDIGENQLNAIRAIALIKDDADVIKSLIVLLSHWDAEARLLAAQVLSDVEDEDVKAAAGKRLNAETEPEIAKILRRLAR